MKHWLYVSIAALAANLAGGAFCCMAQSSAAVDARITSLTCQAELQKVGSSSSVPLKSPADIGRGLVAGYQVRCLGGGYLEVLLPEGSKKITSSQGWLAIQAIPSNPPYPQIGESLRSFGISGATRGIATPSRIVWPAENSAVIPNDFVARWTPLEQKAQLSILSEAKDVTLWGPAEVDGATGVFKSETVSAILAGYQAKNNSTSLVLILSLAKQKDWEEAHFSLLSARQERELTEQLEFWKSHTDGIALRLGRAYCFTRLKLFAEAADEYDAAVKSAPDSRYLLEKAIQANRLAGRPDRANEIQTRLASVPRN